MLSKFFYYVLQWMQDEHDYSRSKVTQDVESDNQKTEEFQARDKPFDSTYWPQQIEMYMHRAWVLGLDTPGGRQALAKAAITLLFFTEHAVRLYGPLPEPGVSSGNNLENLRAIQS